MGITESFDDLHHGYDKNGKFILFTKNKILFQEK